MLSLLHAQILVIIFVPAMEMFPANCEWRLSVDPRIPHRPELPHSHSPLLLELYHQTIPIKNHHIIPNPQSDRIPQDDPQDTGPQIRPSILFLHSIPIPQIWETIYTYYGNNGNKFGFLEGNYTGSIQRRRDQKAENPGKRKFGLILI